MEPSINQVKVGLPVTMPHHQNRKRNDRRKHLSPLSLSSTLLVFTFIMLSHQTSAFLPTPPTLVNTPFTQMMQSMISHPVIQQTVRLQATKLYAIPTLDNWQIKNGSALGRISNHPNPGILDGEIVTTSQLKTNESQMKEGTTVVTASGSKYKLGKPKNAPSNTAQNNKNTKSSSSIRFGGFGGFNSKSSNSPGKTLPSPSKPLTKRGNARNPPVMDAWFISSRGELIGVVSGHPDRSITDGDVLTTSKLQESKSSLKEGDVVTTESGSAYSLGTKKKGFFNNYSSSESAESVGGTFKSSISQSVQEVKSTGKENGKKEQTFNPFGTFRLIKEAMTSAVSPAPASSTPASSTPASRKISPTQQEKARQRQLKDEFGINGKTLANGKYLLCDRGRRSTSGKSNIWSAYKADADGNPIGGKLTIKISTNFDSMTRENSNYNRVCSGLFPGRFVEKTEFLQVMDGFPAKEFDTSCALVIENGKKDLRAILNERGLRGFEGRAMRDAASAALQCIQAMHSSGVVWTDLKTENFVIVSDEIGNNGVLPGVKGIDLESAIERGRNPVDFSPEACPPEFASAFISGQGLTFKLDYSYDMWSYGMMLYELTTGRPYFDGKSPAQITMSLQYEFEPDLSAVSDDKLQDLIRQCLQYDPKKRPGVAQLLLHPYFLTSAFAW